METTPKIYQITHRICNMILIAEEELTLIDTGLRGSASHVIKFVNGIGRSVEEISLIIITHNHLDHAGGLAELRKFTTAKVAAHQADLSDKEDELPYRKTGEAKAYCAQCCAARLNDKRCFSNGISPDYSDSENIL